MNEMDSGSFRAVPTIVDGVITAWTLTYDGPGTEVPVDPVKFAVDAERDRIEAAVLPLLAGIDKDETEADGGRWETAEGAEHGAEVLAKIKDAIRGAKP